MAYRKRPSSRLSRNDLSQSGTPRVHQLNDPRRRLLDRLVGHVDNRPPLPPEQPPLPGDAFSVTAGCDKSFSTCRTKFANHLNFRGFPHLPGADFAYSYAAGGESHDGGALFS